MRILLREMSTGFYYRGDGSWTKDAPEARVFGSIAEAQELARKNGLADLEAVKRLTYLQGLQVRKPATRQTRMSALRLCHWPCRGATKAIDALAEVF